MIDQRFAEPKCSQLPPMDHPLLALRELPDQPVGIDRVTLTPYSGVDVTWSGHGPMVPRRP
jgi:hypothetical protein